MKKLLLTLVMSLVLAAGICADDGGTYYPEDWSYGNIYVKEPNAKIALENEILYFGTDRATAYFDFKNTTQETVKVPCSFPVVIKVPFKIDGNQVKASYFSSDADSVIWEIALNRYLHKAKYEHWQNSITVEDIRRKDKTLRVEKYADYLKQLDSYGVDEDRNYSKRVYSGCNIVLDGKNIPIQHVGIEVNVEINSESDMHGAEIYFNEPFSYLTVVLHFYHELTFKPSGNSQLEVSYGVVSEKRSYHGSEYQAFYDISTGRTWKGNIKSFLINSDFGMEFVNANSKYASFGNFYLFNNYKPNSNEYFVFSKKDYADDPPYVSLGEHNFPKLDYVKNISASSFLKGTYEYYRMVSGDDSETKIKKSDYLPATCFDSDPYNGWVEGVKGDGIGEYISFTLTKKVFGPLAINGLTRFREDYSDEVILETDNDCKRLNRYSSWQENNRVKKMKLSGAGGISKTLDFEDMYSGFGLGYYNKRKYFNSVLNPSILEPDTYKMEIAEVYKGSQYDDTVLGEIWFVEIPDELITLMEQDKARNKSFFTDYIIQHFTEQNVDTKRAKEFLEKRIYNK